jgi:inosine-uridine nucleoside N-ribohydrolase
MRRILLDTDLAMGAPGSDIDDGFALALALADPGLAVELVTTVSGNTDVDTATRLTLGLLARLGRADVPVVRGAPRSLRGWWRGATAQPAAPEPGAVRPVPGQAAVHLVERVMAEPGELTIVAIGPLTNVALALAIEPAVAQRVDEIVVMGGVFLGHTNLSVMPGEFNTWADPVATAMVLASGAPLRFVGLDVTEQVRLTRADAAMLAGSGRDFGAFAGECAEQWISHKASTNPGESRAQESCAMHDPLAVATVTRPDLVSWRPAFVQVETASELTRGVMVADLLTLDQPPEPNCQIAVAVDSAAFIDLFLERVATL